METKTRILPEFFLQDDVPEMPRQAPQPTSKPQLEDIFRGRQGGRAAHLTLKNLQAERLKYKQMTANLKNGLVPIPEAEVQEATAVQRFQSVLATVPSTLDRHTPSPAQMTPRRFRGGSMSDRKRRDLSAEIANATVSALASVQRAETRMRSPSPRHAKVNRTEVSVVKEERKESPSAVPPVPVFESKPSKTESKKSNKAKPEVRPEARKQPSQASTQKKEPPNSASEKRSPVTAVQRARSISPLHHTPSKPIAEVSILDAKAANKKKKITKAEASDLAKRLQGTNSAYERL